jgi:ketosteroid isomerase-like protein
VAQATAPAQSPEIDEPVAEGARNGESAPSPTSTTIPLIFNLTALSSAEVADVNNVLQSWADAWRNKDTDAYFGHYHADYKAPEATSVAAWREQRIARISAPDAIDISLAELEILENNDNNLLIELLMEYHTDNYSDRTLKRMMLSKSAQGLWLITMENNIEVKRL